MRTLWRWASLSLASAVVILAGLGSGTEQALSQNADELPYAPDRIIVKLKDNIPSNSLSRIADVNGEKNEESLRIANLNVVELPENLSVPKAIDLYETSPSVEYATPDYKVYSNQSCDPPPEEPDPTDPVAGTENGDPECVDPAPEEEPPPDPTEDDVIATSESNYSRASALTPNDPEYPELYGLNNTGQSIKDAEGVSMSGLVDADMDAPEAWSLTTGTPETVVAVLDSGIDINHPDLRDNIWTNPDEVPGNGVDDDGNGYVDDVNGWDFSRSEQGDSTVYDPNDNELHGTHVAGIIAAEGNNGIGVSGVGWNTKIMPVKFMVGNTGYFSRAVKALRYAMGEGAKISNNSWGCMEWECTYYKPLHDAINEANASGHLFVVAAGNDAENADLYTHYPSGFDSPNIISVAATDNRDNLAYFSNYGATMVDLAAPGDRILSTAPNNSYAKLHGTSMAAPYVSGVAALLQSKDPSLSHTQIKDRILQTTEKKAPLSGKTITGGRLNAAAALGLKLTELSSSTSPNLITYGSGTAISGKLTSFGVGLAGKSVIIEKLPAGATDFVPIATTTTSSGGSFSYGPSRPDRHTRYRARFAGEQSTGFESSTSPATSVSVRVGVTLSVAGANLKLGRARTIAGYVSPNHAGKPVSVLVRRGGVPILRRSLALNASSRYTWTYRPPRIGYYSFSVTYAGDIDNSANASPTRGYRVVN